MTSVVKYFNGERFRCYSCIAFAIASIVAAFFLLLIFRNKFFTGLAFPFIGFPLVILTACKLMLYKISKDHRRVSQIISKQPELIRIQEFPRMKTLLRILMVIKILTVLLASVGFCVLVLMKTNSLVAGAGLGLGIQSVIILAVDHFAIRCGLLYWDFLQSTYKSHQLNLGFKFHPSQPNA